MGTVIEVNGLTKKFGEFTAVDGLSFGIVQNEIFGLLGPNGAGKTTTINMICGLLPSTGGSIRFNGSSGNDRKSLIGYCPQENIFYPKLTCLEQLQFIGQMYGLTVKNVKSRAKELLGLLGLSDKTNERAANLSGGMKRRLNICLALVHNPEILILDEPEAGLDPQSRILVRDFIKAFGKEKTVLLTTHNMDEADRMADRIAIMDYGKMLLLDTPHNLKKTVGEGDVLEIIPENGSEEQIDLFTEKVTPLVTLVKKSTNSILFKHRNMVQLIPAVRQIAEDAGLAIGEIKLRENTLEDVFIYLTGRTLRQ
jgi:ABC-2 type transport system ATP-binding protein